MQDKNGNTIVRTTRPESGHLSIEVACSAIFLLAFTVLGVEGGLMLYGALLNDRVCRESARAAAFAQNSEEATQRALSVAARQPVGSMLSRPRLAVVYEDFSRSKPEQAWASPYVTVTAETTARHPMGQFKLLPGAVFGGNDMVFRQSYSFPILRLSGASWNGAGLPSINYRPSSTGIPPSGMPAAGGAGVSFAYPGASSSANAPGFGNGTGSAPTGTLGLGR